MAFLTPASLYLVSLILHRCFAIFSSCISIFLLSLLVLFVRHLHCSAYLFFLLWYPLLLGVPVLWHLWFAQPFCPPSLLHLSSANLPVLFTLTSLIRTLTLFFRSVHLISVLLHLSFAQFNRPLYYCIFMLSLLWNVFL